MTNLDAHRWQGGHQVRMLLSFQRPAASLVAGTPPETLPGAIAPERAMESSAPGAEGQSPFGGREPGSTAARKSSSRAAGRKGRGWVLAGRRSAGARPATVGGVPGPANGRLGKDGSALGRPGGSDVREFGRGRRIRSRATTSALERRGVGHESCA